MPLWDLSIEELRGLASQKGFAPYYEENGDRKPLASEDLRIMLTRLGLREKGLELYSYRDLEAGCSPSARQGRVHAGLLHTFAPLCAGRAFLEALRRLRRRLVDLPSWHRGPPARASE